MTEMRKRTRKENGEETAANDNDGNNVVVDDANGELEGDNTYTCTMITEALITTQPLQL